MDTLADPVHEQGEPRVPKKEVLIDPHLCGELSSAHPLNTTEGFQPPKLHVADA